MAQLRYYVWGGLGDQVAILADSKDSAREVLATISSGCYDMMTDEDIENEYLGSFEAMRPVMRSYSFFDVERED